MRIHKTIGVTIGCLVLALASIASAQTTGSIRGTVVDDTGAVLPGATVTIYSDAILGGSRTDVTNGVGVYRFPGLAVGLYVVEVTMQGFDTVRTEGVQVALNATATVNATLKIATVSETVTVVGESPVVDVQSSSSRTSFKNELVQDLPTNRNFYDYIQLAPGMSAVFTGGNSDRTVAFGSNQQSNSWNIDGIETSAPETGSSWWSINPDMIEEVEILGVGAPAEFGNATGGVFNVVTKKGGNDFSGTANFFFQTDGLTGNNAEVDGIPYTRDVFRNFTGQIGGPIVSDKAWFFGAYSHFRDSGWQPGNDPSVSTSDLSKSDMVDGKGTFRLGTNHELGVLFHAEEWAFVGGSRPWVEASAAPVERGVNYAWGGNITSTISPSTLFEARYAGWWGDDISDSPTGSFEEPFIDYTPPDGGPPSYSGGVVYPWDYVTWSQQVNAKVTHYSEDFLSAQQEFKFGVQFARGSAKTNVSAGPNSSYSYNYYGYAYRVIQTPYQYGGESRDLAFFVDDTVTIGNRATLNLGVRLDLNRGWIPDYKRLAPILPPQPTRSDESIATAINAVETDITIPGVSNYINWNLVSPRLGATVQLDDEGRSIVKGFFGILYDQNVIGNWDAPAPEVPPWQLFLQDPSTGDYDLIFETTSQDLTFHPNLRPPKSRHYTVGFEQQVGNDMAFGVQYVHKYTDNLIGWEILDGGYDTLPFVDPYTGTEYQLLNQIEQPTLRKGNGPGNFPGAADTYDQTYDGVSFTWERRMRDNWSLYGSYTYSKSEGLIPRPWFQSQNNPFYGSTAGQDPNSYLNADQRLQADRPHMFRLQGVFMLPGDFIVAPNMNFESGKPFSRQTRGPGDLTQPSPYIILASADTNDPSVDGDRLRLGTNWILDLNVGKRFYWGGAEIKLDGIIYNLFNSGAVLTLADLRLTGPPQTFREDEFILPRRLMVKLGVVF